MLTSLFTHVLLIVCISEVRFSLSALLCLSSLLFLLSHVYCAHGWLNLIGGFCALHLMLSLLGVSPGCAQLAFSSLIFQIENAKTSGYSESEICAAVIKSISPDCQLRSYLEGRANLPLTSLSKVLRSHFKEKDATTLFTSLSNSKQGNHESAHEFVIRLMSL